MVKNKYNIGDNVLAKINYMNDNRAEIEAVIYGIEFVEETNSIRYKIHFEPNEFDKKQGCTGCTGYVDDIDIIGYKKKDLSNVILPLKLSSKEFKTVEYPLNWAMNSLHKDECIKFNDLYNEDRNKFTENFNEAVNGLKGIHGDRNIEIFKSIFEDKMSITEVADKYVISKERVRQIIMKITRCLRHPSTRKYYLP